MTSNLPPMLVVDDEKNMRLSLESIMSEEGYQYRAAESAEEALKLLDQEEFFMVITDARLGGMSGYEFLAKMRQKFPAIPVSRPSHTWPRPGTPGQLRGPIPA